MTNSKPGSKRKLRFSAVELLIAIVLLIALAPLVEDLRSGVVIVNMLAMVMLVSAVLAVGSRWRTRLLALLLAVPAVAGKLLDYTHPGFLPAWAQPIASLGFITFVIWHLLGFVLRAEKVNAEVLCASIAAYLMLAILWSLAYTIVAVFNPQAFTLSFPGSAGQKMEGFNATYFSFVTLSTVGYGDIAPVSRPARMLAAIEAMTGMFYMAVLVARLVSLYSVPGASKGNED